MSDSFDKSAAGKPPSRRLFVYNGGFLTQSRVRRILKLSGYNTRIGRPKDGDLIGVWGQSPTAHRGETAAVKHDVPIVRVEDAFLRSIHPGRTGSPPIGLTIDHSGVHFDPAAPSDLEKLLTTHPLDDTALLNRARAAIARLQEAHLSKYTGFDPKLPPPDPGYVLVIDQTRDDASVLSSNGNRALFLEMLVFAQEEHPGVPVIIKSHPETAQGLRPGYYDETNCNDRISICSDPISPWALLEGAVGVYTVSSQMGFEAIFAGHKPRVFGQPFYSGWGLTADENPVPRRERKLTRAQLFAAAMILYPKWYDPYRDRLTTLEGAIDALEAQTNAWRDDHKGWVASHISLWKRGPMQKVFGQEKRMIFSDDPTTAPDRPKMVWASKAGPFHDTVTRVEDGFLRSRGLGAELVPPLSLVLDDLGIYYDPIRPSRLENLIAARADLRDDQTLRADRLIDMLTQEELSKYNVGLSVPLLPPGHRILVAGQVEDDASILTGTSTVRTNQDLLAAARKANPDAIILFKPHPDVEAGLRPGAITPGDLADMVLTNINPAQLLPEVQEVWTMTSLLGFEALLRGLPVTTLGAPFYAGWGLTTDLGDIPPRRRALPTIQGLVHATLIDYPRYFDPITGLACPVEVVAERLARGQIPNRGPANRAFSKLQGKLASYAHLWR